MQNSLYGSIKGWLIFGKLDFSSEEPAFPVEWPLESEAKGSFMATSQARCVGMRV